MAQFTAPSAGGGEVGWPQTRADAGTAERQRPRVCGSITGPQECSGGVNGDRACEREHPLRARRAAARTAGHWRRVSGRPDHAGPGGPGRGHRAPDCRAARGVHGMGRVCRAAGERGFDDSAGRPGGTDRVRAHPVHGDVRRIHRRLHRRAVGRRSGHHGEPGRHLVAHPVSAGNRAWRCCDASLRPRSPAPSSC